MKVYELPDADTALGAEVQRNGAKAVSVVSVDLPTIGGYAAAPIAHTYVTDELVPMPAYFEFALTDPRAIKVPEGAKFCGIYFKHTLTAGDVTSGLNREQWAIQLRVMGLVPDGELLKPLTVFPWVINAKGKQVYGSPTDYALQVFHYFLDTSGYRNVLSTMSKMVVPPGISHIYPMFRYANAITYPPKTGPLTFHVRFW